MPKKYYNSEFDNSMVEKESGWDIRLQCTICGFRVRRHRLDYSGSLGSNPKATIIIECSNCTCEAGYPKNGVKTTHFIDIIDEK